MATDVPDWSQLEQEVRTVASYVWDRPARAEEIAGVRLDCVVRLTADYLILVEVSKTDTLDKLRTDLAKFAVVRPALFAQSIYAQAYFVTRYAPPPSLRESGDRLNVKVMSLPEFTSQFFDFASYAAARMQYPFGSAVNPDTGAGDETAYVPVRYTRGNAEVSIEEIVALLITGKRLILLGEFGTGKSRAFKELFHRLAEQARDVFRYPLAINLRENWGLKRGMEIIRRHFAELGQSGLADSAVKIARSSSLIWLLDGFDEIGSQTWGDDPKKLQHIRQASLTGVKDLLANSAGGAIVAGREHYFNSDDEMYEALGLSQNSAEIIRCNNEFTPTEMATYLSSRGKRIRLPEWLPRRPLLCQTIANLPNEDIEKLSSVQGSDGEFCLNLLDVICKREARIAAILERSRISEIMRLLARRARHKHQNTGPITVSEINEAFETVVGTPPVDDSAVMLQRLPGLGRLGAESSDRVFVDNYLLEGFRALDVIHIVNNSDENAAREKWLQPLYTLGQNVVAFAIDDKNPGESTTVLKPFLHTIRQCTKFPNRVLAADIAASLVRTTTVGDTIDFGDIEIREGSFGPLHLGIACPARLSISECVIEELTLPVRTPTDVVIRDCYVGRMRGVSSSSVVPAWIINSSPKSVEQVGTVSQIKDADLTPAQMILVTFVKKTFFQPGSGRKDEALVRGLGERADQKLAEKILKLLVKEGMLSPMQGDEGRVFRPVRSNTHRMKDMMAELRLSKDPIWIAVSKM